VEVSIPSSQKPFGLRIVCAVFMLKIVPSRFERIKKYNKLFNYCLRPLCFTVITGGQRVLILLSVLYFNVIIRQNQVIPMFRERRRFGARARPNHFTMGNQKFRRGGPHYNSLVLAHKTELTIDPSLKERRAIVKARREFSPFVSLYLWPCD